ncbi:MAG: energy transducer TonB [Candidatus Zixiibacteriota bacterium]
MPNKIFLLLIIIILASAISAAEVTQFNIKVSLMDEAGKSVRGAGSIMAEEGAYGRINIAFYDDQDNFKINAVGTVQKPARMLESGKEETYFTGELDAVIDLYLTPAIMEDGKIRLSGYATKMTSSPKVGPDYFRYDEEGMDFVVPNGGEHEVRLKLGDLETTAILRIAAYSIGDLKPAKEVERKLVFNTEYKLINYDANTVELQGRGCTLTFSGKNRNESGKCAYEKVFMMPDGDSLLYSVECAIRNPQWNDDGSASFDFEVGRIYATNPVRTGPNAEKLEADEGVLTSFRKRLTVLPGERTEIEVPPDKDSPLPFKAGDFIALSNPEQFIPLDATPELINSVPPVYPQDAKKKNIGGKVMISAFIGTDGMVKNARVIECTRPGNGFEEAALEAAYKSIYKPGMSGMKPTAVWITYTVEFKMD